MGDRLKSCKLPSKCQIICRRCAGHVRACAPFPRGKMEGEEGDGADGQRRRRVTYYEAAVVGVLLVVGAEYE